MVNMDATGVSFPAKRLITVVLQPDIIRIEALRRCGLLKSKSSMGLRAIQKGEDVKGVKGPSVVGILPSFDQVRGKVFWYIKVLIYKIKL